MRFFWSILLLFCLQARAEDVGDGSDGDCTVTGIGTQITATRKTYQCTSLTIDADLDVFSGNNAIGSGGSAVVIKVQNNVTVVAGTTIDLSGAAGVDGNSINAIKPGGPSGAGGGAGGNSVGVSMDGTNGSGAGGGIAGKNVTPFPSAYGGGGGGGSYGTKAALEPTPGDNSVGSVPLSVGANGIIYGNEANFETTFIGGSGGGAGGGGNDSIDPFTGSSGGGGGGALRIIAGGNIVIDGTILANGGDGGGTGATTYAGGGGGGSGGAIWLQAAGHLSISPSGTLSVAGGSFGENDFAGFGGNGGLGRIRLDDGDGIIANSGTVTPVTIYTSVFTPTPPPTPPPTPDPTSGASGVRQYSSNVSCAKVALDSSSENFVINLILGLGLSLGFGLLTKRKIRS